MEIGGNGGSTQRYYQHMSSNLDFDINQSGEDGERGEDCGKITINNSLIVNAYGGAGGSGGKYENIAGSSGTGGGGYPAAGIGGGGAGAGAGMHIQGGGGYSPGVCQITSDGTQFHNGTYGSVPELYAEGNSGGAYFSESKYDNRIFTEPIAGAIGGQGGMNGSNWWKDSGGDGGIAGQGGEIVVSSQATVNAYNGNECTLKETDSGYYYKPLEIFAQNGIHRAVYKNNLWWDVMDTRKITFFEELWGKNNLTAEAYATKIANQLTEMKNVKVKDAYNTTPLKYTYNGKEYDVGYGIGSGAGYIELSNGTYTVAESMN